MAKSKTLDRLEAMRQKAVRFLENVVGDTDRADEFADMSNEIYADHKGIKIANPRLTPSNKFKGDATMATKQMTRAELLERVEELEEENDILSDKLDSISAIAEDDDEEPDDQGSDDQDLDDE